MDMENSLEFPQFLQDVARIRACEILLLEEFKTGSIKGTIHTSIGQEYVPVMLANLAPKAFWFSNHRGHAHYLAKTSDYSGLLAEILGYEGATSAGVGGSQHLYWPESFISNGIQGGQLGIAVGMSSKLSSPEFSSIFFMGDGTTGAGHIYESMNLAVLQKSRLLVILENNGIAQSTPTNLTLSGNLRERFLGFGFEYLSWSPSGIGVQEDLDELYFVLKKAVNNMEQGIPTLVNVSCNRLGPHSKGDDNRPSAVINELERQDYLNRAIIENLYCAWEENLQEIRVILNEVKNRKRVTAKGTLQKDRQSNTIMKGLSPSKIKLRDSANRALKNAISNHASILIGEDILDFPISGGSKYGGAFKVTSGLSSEFPSMVHNFPISESAMLGFATGVAITGKNVIVEIMFSDFLAQGLDQIIHQISKLQSIYGRSLEVPLLIRTASGPGKGYGPTHSHTLEGQLVGLPNIEVVSANPFVSYQEILDLWFVEKKCFIVFEPKELYAYSSLDFNSYMYKIQNPEDIYEPVQIKPIHVKADVTVVVYGSAIWDLIDDLDSLLYDLEIGVHVLIPTVLSGWRTSSFYESLRSTNGKVLAITDNLNTNGFLDNVIIEAFNKGQIKRFESMRFLDWIPSGFSEDEVTHTTEKIRAAIRKVLNQ